MRQVTCSDVLMFQEAPTDSEQQPGGHPLAHCQREVKVDSDGDGISSVHSVLDSELHCMLYSLFKVSTFNIEIIFLPLCP